MLGFLQKSVAHTGQIKIFILGLAIGVFLGILGGRLAERFRLLDYVAIEQMILERERPSESRPNRPPRYPPPDDPFRL